jgi:[ribosomal protein S5]-alanine N-acetyltransferase
VRIRFDVKEVFRKAVRTARSRSSMLRRPQRAELAVWYERMVDALRTPVPHLQTKRLLLREVVLADVPAYERHFVDYEVIRNLARVVPWPYPAGGVESFVRNVLLPAQGLERWTWGVFLQPTPLECMGVVDLWREARPDNRGFWLARSLWGQGLMTEAVAAVNDCAFGQLGFQRLVFSNARGNLRSRRVKEKTGARFLGVEPALFVDASLSERELWETTRDDWLQFRSSAP